MLRPAVKRFINHRVEIYTIADFFSGYLDIDIEQDPKAAEFVKQQNGGFQSVPTIIFPDGSSLTEPDRTTLANKLETYLTTA